MTQLAHDCALLRIPFDSWRLFAEGDLHYAMFLSIVCDKVNATNRANAAKASSGKKK